MELLYVNSEPHTTLSGLYEELELAYNTDTPLALPIDEEE